MTKKRRSVWLLAHNKASHLTVIPALRASMPANAGGVMAGLNNLFVVPESFLI